MWLPTVHRPICNQDAYNQYSPTKNQAANNLIISSPITKPTGGLALLRSLIHPAEPSGYSQIY